jgi:hypothetical protein
MKDLLGTGWEGWLVCWMASTALKTLAVVAAFEILINL